MARKPKVIADESLVQSANDALGNGRSLLSSMTSDNAARRSSPQSSAVDEPPKKEVIPELERLADFLARSARKGTNLDEVWHDIRAALHETLSLLSAMLPTLFIFGDDCNAQLEILLERVRGLAAALTLSVGDTVSVEYEDRWYEGKVTGLEDVLRVNGAAVRVLYGDSGEELPEDFAEGGLRLVARGPRRPAARAGGAPPFHLAEACAGGGAAEALPVYTQ